MKLAPPRTWAVILFLVTAMPVSVLYRIPVSNAQGTEYVLHVLMNGPWCSAFLPPIRFSGDYSGVVWPPGIWPQGLDIGPYSSHFTVTLNAENSVSHTGQLCEFVHWTLDGLEMDSSSMQVTVDDSHPDRTAVAYYTITSPAPPLPTPVVGGIVMPANTVALLSPWLAVIGLVGCIGTAAVVVRKRRA